MSGPAARRTAWPTRPGLLLVIDSRRPASWVATVAAAATVLAVSLAPVRAPALVGFVVGGLLAVAARGCVPRGLADGITTLWLAERAVWPLAGVVAACALLLLSRPDVVGPAAAAVGVGIVAGTVTMLGATRRGVHTADAASLAVAVVCGAALLAGGSRHLSGAVHVDERATESRMVVTVGVLWLAVAGLTGIVASRVGPAAAFVAAPPAVGTAAGPVRLVLLWLAMVTSLAGMTTCFFLAPAQAGWYPLVVLAWFTSLALPQATLLMGDEAAAGWRRLMQSISDSALAVAGCRTAATIGGLLGWPAAVALAVRTAVPGDAEQVIPAAVASLVGLAGAVTVVSLAGVVASGSRATRETAFAVACAVFAAALVGAAGLPELPGLPRTGP